MKRTTAIKDKENELEAVRCDFEETIEKMVEKCQQVQLAEEEEHLDEPLERSASKENGDDDASDEKQRNSDSASAQKAIVVDKKNKVFVKR